MPPWERYKPVQQDSISTIAPIPTTEDIKNTSPSFVSSSEYSKLPPEDRPNGWERLAGASQPVAASAKPWERYTAKPVETKTEQPKPEGTGIARTALDQGMQGATFGFADEIMNPLGALASAIYENPTGTLKSVVTGKTPEVSDSLNEQIASVKDTSKERLKAQMQENPVTSIASQIGGSLLTGGAGASTKAGTAVANSLRTGGLAARATKAALAGSASGGLYGAGTADEGNRLEGAKEGAAFGAGVGAATPVIGAALGAVKNAVVPKVASGEVARLAKKAIDEGIPLSRSQIGDSRFAKAISSVTQSVPFSGAKGFAEKQISAFNKAVLSKAGIKAETATPDVLNKAADDFNKRFASLTARTGVTVDNSLLNEFAGIEAEASRRLGADATKTVKSYVDDILASGGKIDGKTYQNTRSQLGKMANSTTDSFLKDIYKSMQTALDDAAFKSLPKSSQSEWQQVRKQYGAFKTIQKAMTNSGEQAARGNISPAQLAIAAKSGNSRYAMGAGELNDLARIGSAFIKDAIPNSGSPERLAAYGTLFGAPGAFAAGATGAALAPAAGVGASRAFNAINNFQPMVRRAVNNANSITQNQIPSQLSLIAAMLQGRAVTPTP